MSRYRLAARWHAYRARTEGVPVPATPWTGPAAEPLTWEGIPAAVDRLGQVYPSWVEARRWEPEMVSC